MSGRGGNLCAWTFRAWAERQSPRRHVLCPGGTATSARGRSGSGRDGDLCAGGVSCLGGTAIFTRGTFRAWAGGRFSRRSVSCLVGTAITAQERFASGWDSDLHAWDVQGLGGMTIFAQERFVPGRNSGLRAWTFRVWARRRSLCGRRFVSGRGGDLCAWDVQDLGGTAILARETAGRSGATGRARECPHALYGSGGATISSFSAAGASVAAQSRQSPTSARHRQAIRCPRRNTSVSPAQRVRKPPARPSPVSFR